MDVLLVEPYCAGSHAAWARGYRRFSRGSVELLTLSGANWKWRMHGGAVTLARRFLESGRRPDVVLATDMLDLTTFLALTREQLAGVPVVTYFHENQMSYPWSPDDRDVRHKRDKHYAFINYATALASDVVLFNSNYHMLSFLDESMRLLKHFPDHNELKSVEILEGKSSVLPLGVDLKRFDEYRVEKTPGAPPLVLWNHRWEYDKNPDDFFDVLAALADDGVEFEVCVLGQRFGRAPEAFDRARRRLGGRIVQFGCAERPEDYARWLWRADVLPVTSNQDFFGASVVEAMYCETLPLLPKRLAYPELVPERLHDHAFYHEGGLRDALARALTSTGRAEATYRGAAARFDWSTMVGVYDDTLEALVVPAGDNVGSME